VQLRNMFFDSAGICSGGEIEKHPDSRSPLHMRTGLF
jgi:hypothetical protein